MIMTKYVLLGGGLTQLTASSEFFSEFLKGFTGSVNILCIYFAVEKEYWEPNLVSDQQKFSLSRPDLHFHYELADEKISEFEAQIQRADILYIRGGDSHLLQTYFEPIQHLEQKLNGKVVAGSSAGALIFSKHYYENDDDTFNEGLGLLPFKLLCHASEENLDKLEQLKSFGNTAIPTTALGEEKFIVITK